jgi:hypothetical protein
MPFKSLVSMHISYQRSRFVHASLFLEKPLPCISTIVSIPQVSEIEMVHLPYAWTVCPTQEKSTVLPVMIDLKVMGRIALRTKKGHTAYSRVLIYHDIVRSLAS